MRIIVMHSTAGGYLGQGKGQQSLFRPQCQHRRRARAQQYGRQLDDDALTHPQQTGADHVEWLAKLFDERNGQVDGGDREGIIIMMKKK